MKVLILSFFIWTGSSREFNSPPVSTKSDSSHSVNSPVCVEIVMDLLSSSNRFKVLTKGFKDAIIKKGGTSYGLTLEGSPNPREDDALAYSKTYDISLHESYPDRNVVIARFSFNQNTGKLYERDNLADTLVQIPYDKSLLFKYRKHCH